MIAPYIMIASHVMFHISNVNIDMDRGVQVCRHLAMWVCWRNDQTMDLAEIGYPLVPSLISIFIANLR